MRLYYKNINETPFHYACEKNDTDLIEYLISKGADINAKTIPNNIFLIEFFFTYYIEIL